MRRFGVWIRSHTYILVRAGGSFACGYAGSTIMNVVQSPLTNFERSYSPLAKSRSNSPMAQGRLGRSIVISFIRAESRSTPTAVTVGEVVFTTAPDARCTQPETPTNHSRADGRSSSDYRAEITILLSFLAITITGGDGAGRWCALSQGERRTPAAGPLFVDTSDTASLIAGQLLQESNTRAWLAHSLAWIK